MIYRTAENGDKYLLKRHGVIPIAPEGYEAYPTDPYRFRPIIKPCVFRTQGFKIMQKCQCKVSIDHCLFFGHQVSKMTCMHCTERKES